MPENNGNLLLVYIVADESYSMHEVMGQLNSGLESLYEALLGEPMAAAKIRLSILGFSNDVQVRMEMADLRRETGLPLLVARQNTRYDVVFADLRQRIPADVKRLKAQGYAVHRPAVFFLSDGQPSEDGWQSEYDQLIDRNRLPAAPNIVAFGVGGADAATILEVATAPEYGFVALGDVDVAQAIAKFCTALTRSMVKSGQSLGSAQPALVVERPQNFTMAIDVV